MDPEMVALLTEVGYAAGIGVFVGLERAHSETEEHGPTPETTEQMLGVRTFTLLSVFGWVVGYLGDHVQWLPAAGLVVTGALLAARHIGAEDEHGLTTEVAAAIVFALGILVRFNRTAAVVIALFTTLALISKPWVRTLVPKVRRVELTATLQVLIVLAVVLPLLPDRSVDPWGAIVPREIGWFVLLIGGISYLGYFLSRILGERRSAGVVGLVGGLASSTATTAAMGQRARDAEAMVAPGQLATFLANTMMFARVLVVAGVVAPAVVSKLAVPLGTMGVVVLGGAVYTYRQMRRRPRGDDSREALQDLKNPFALLPALKWGLLITVVLLLAALAQEHVGERGLLAAAAASGVADVDAITLAVSRQVTEGVALQSTGALAITLAVVANTIFKAGIAVFVGRWRFARRVVLVFAASMAAGIVAALLV